MAVEFTHYALMHGFIPVVVGWDGLHPHIQARSYLGNFLLYGVEGFIRFNRFLGLPSDDFYMKITGKIDK